MSHDLFHMAGLRADWRETAERSVLKRMPSHELRRLRKEAADAGDQGQRTVSKIDREIDARMKQLRLARKMESQWRRRKVDDEWQDTGGEG